MRKATITPMDYYYYQLYVHKISKEELEEAGIVIDYTDEPYKAAKKMKQNAPQKESKKMRWTLLALLMIYTSIIMKVGMICIEQRESEEMSLTTSSEYVPWTEEQT